jgi:hypothetical protein
VSERDDAKLDRLLAEGRASGPTLDRVWARLDASLDAETHPVRAPLPFWRRPFVALGASLSVAVTAVALVILIRPADDARDPFSPRGVTAAHAPAPLFVASCGAHDKPCVVDEEVAISLVDDAGRGTVEISLDDADGSRVLAPTFAITPGMARVLPLVIVPEARDVEHGLTIRWRVTDDGLVPSALESGSIRLHVVTR